jgi:hypothetical protein
LQSQIVGTEDAVREHDCLVLDTLVVSLNLTLKTTSIPVNVISIVALLFLMQKDPITTVDFATPVYKFMPCITNTSIGYPFKICSNIAEFANRNSSN